MSVRGKTIEDEVVREFSCGLLGSMGDIGTETKACCTLGGRRWDSDCLLISRRQRGRDRGAKVA